jgi:hypothetical protein
MQTTGGTPPKGHGDSDISFPLIFQNPLLVLPSSPSNFSKSTFKVSLYLRSTFQNPLLVFPLLLIVLSDNCDMIRCVATRCDHSSYRLQLFYAVAVGASIVMNDWSWWYEDGFVSEFIYDLEEVPPVGSC